MSKPRKPYRPRHAGRPILSGMRDELILPAHAALSILRTSADRSATESAVHTLAATLNYLYVATGSRDEPRASIESGLQALQVVKDRGDAGAAYRCTGPEILALTGAVNTCDAVLPYLRTDEVVRAIKEVDRVLFGQSMERSADGAH